MSELYHPYIIGRGKEFWCFITKYILQLLPFSSFSLCFVRKGGGSKLESLRIQVSTRKSAASLYFSSLHLLEARLRLRWAALQGPQYSS